jgi:hypothetical protein
VPLATSDPSGPWPCLEVLDTTAAVLAAAGDAPAAARAVVPPPPARKLTAAKPASSFLFMVSPLRLAILPFYLSPRGQVNACNGGTYRYKPGAKTQLEVEVQGPAPPMRSTEVLR